MQLNLASESPLISCVMPTYGRPDYLPESVGMFLAQDYPRKELVILNDCPGQVFNCEVEGVRVVNVKERFRTLGEKRNVAIQLAQGNWIAVWDDDDVYLPWHLSQAMKEIQRSGIPFYRPAEFWAYWGEPELQANQAAPGWVNHAIVVFQKRLWSEVGGYPPMNVGEDAKLFQSIHELLRQEFITSPVEPHDRSFILRGKSAYRHSCMPGGEHPLDTTPGVYGIEPRAIHDRVLRGFHDELTCKPSQSAPVQICDPSGQDEPRTVGLSADALPLPLLSVCIAVKNRSRLPHGDGFRELLPRCVRSLAMAAEEIGPVELVISDYDSTDWPLELWIDEAAGALQVQCVRMDGDFSRGAGLNASANVARSDRLFLCDAEILVEPNVLRRGIAELDRGNTWFPVFRHLDEHDELCRWEELSYGLAFVPRDLFHAVGGVPEFKSWGGEDDIFHGKMARQSEVVRSHEPGLRHIWHDEECRHRHYVRPRKADYLDCMAQPGRVRPGGSFTSGSAKAAARDAVRDFSLLYRNGNSQRHTRDSIELGPAVFPAYGTLLGMLREGDVIAHDTDVDFGCLSWPGGQLPEVGSRHGQFTLVACYHHNSFPCQLVFQHDNGVKVDLFLFEPVHQWRRVASFPDEFLDHDTILEYFPAGRFEAWESLTCWGERFFVPAEPERLLDMMYGSDWRQSNPYWSFDDHNNAASIQVLSAIQSPDASVSAADCLDVCAVCPQMTRTNRLTVGCRASENDYLITGIEDCPLGRWRTRPQAVETSTKSSRATQSTIRPQPTQNNNCVHFVWLGSDLPRAHAAELNRFKDLNPGLNVWLWTKVPVSMPSDLSDVFHHAAPLLCQKSDIIRVWMLLKYGGMYFDTDIAWLGSVEHLRDRRGLWAVDTHMEASNFAMGALPGDPLVEAYRRLILAKAEQGDYHGRSCYGPDCLAELVCKGVETLPRYSFDAVSSHKRRLAIWNAQPEERLAMVKQWKDCPIEGELMGIHAGLDART